MEWDLDYGYWIHGGGMQQRREFFVNNLDKQRNLLDDLELHSMDELRLELKDPEWLELTLSKEYTNFEDPPPNKATTSTTTPPLNLYSNNAETKAKILALEERFDTTIGPNVRRLIYSEILCHSPKSVGQSLGQHGNAGTLQTWIWTWFFFVFSWILIRFFRVTPESAERSKDILKREFEHLSRVLESGPPGPAYLVGNEFTAADLTLACLASLLVGVTQEDGYGAWVPPMSVFRPEAQEFLKELRESTAGQHILECYRLHRGKKAEGSKYGFSFFGWW
ncbi:hypothetical protein BG000_010044 [Podila horticola]|nr:hypothetical protein BG000_010044 [Podila horticola]